MDSGTGGCQLPQHPAVHYSLKHPAVHYCLNTRRCTTDTVMDTLLQKYVCGGTAANKALCTITDPTRIRLGPN